MDQNKSVTEICFPRIGLIGNPSDGFSGKTISFLLANFTAEVRIEPHDRILICPNPDLDLLEFNGTEDFLNRIKIQVISFGAFLRYSYAVLMNINH